MPQKTKKVALDENSVVYQIVTNRFYDSDPALEVYREKGEWNKLVKRAMVADYSWERSAREYVKLYQIA